MKRLAQGRWTEKWWTDKRQGRRIDTDCETSFPKGVLLSQEVVSRCSIVTCLPAPVRTKTVTYQKQGRRTDSHRGSEQTDRQTCTVEKTDIGAADRQTLGDGRQR